MTTVLDELSGNDLNIEKSYIENRVLDWKKRLNSLYDEIQGWMPDHVAFDRSATIPMHEEMMRKYDVPSTVIPILHAFDSSKQIAKFVPRGLWIIGANGRVDLYAGGEHFLIFDRATNFSPPNWEIASAETRQHFKPLTAGDLRRMLRV